MNHFEWSWEQAGTKFFAQGWNPPQTRAVVCLVHGFGEHSSRYEHVARKFADAGFATLAYDQFGHGKTEGKRGFAPSYEASLDSVKRILDEAETRFPGVPKFLYGHSMGGNVVLNYLLRRKPNIKGGIVTGPWLHLAFDPPAIKIMLARIMNTVYPAWPENAALDVDAISRDKEEVRKYVNDPLVHSTARAGTFFDTFNAGKWALEHAGDLSLPLLHMHGTGDRLTSCPASEEFAKAAPQQLITFKTWDGYYHELHNESEPDRSQVISTMINWVNSKL